LSYLFFGDRSFKLIKKLENCVIQNNPYNN